MELIITFLTSFIATLLSSISGGGSGIITVPIFLALGMPLQLVVNIGSVNGIFWTPLAALNYLRGRKIHWRFIIIFTLIGLVGAYFGAHTLLNIDLRVFEIIVGLLIVSMVIFNYFKKDLGLYKKPVYSTFRQLLAYPFGLILGFYEGFFGAGNGILFSMVSFYTRGFDFIDALGSYYAISFSWCLLSAVILIRQGFFDINIMFVAIAGSIIGGYTGSRYARYKGNKFIKISFVVIGGILGLKLLLGL
jgi:hypothetical protein